MTEMIEVETGERWEGYGHHVDSVCKFKEIGDRRCHAQAQAQAQHTWYLRGGAPCLPRAFRLCYCLEIRLGCIVSLG
jgi:hypothetical protein